MGSFLTYLKEDKEDQWLTIHHQHVLVGADGTIKAGFGGKFNGKPVQHAIDSLNAETSKNKGTPAKKATPTKEKAAKPDKPKSKMQHAVDIIKNAPEGTLAKDIKKQLIDKLGLTPAGASTYYHNIKKKLADGATPAPAKKTVKDVVPKQDDDKAPAMSQNEKELKALEIIKGLSPKAYDIDMIGALIDNFKGMPFDVAADLVNKVKKVLSKTIDKQAISDKIYQDGLKSGITKQQMALQLQKALKADQVSDVFDYLLKSHNDHEAGPKVHTYHTKSLAIPDEKHVQKFRSRVTLAKEVNAHMAMEPHDHLVKQYTDAYNRAPKAIQKMSDAIYQYTGSSYHYINGALRSQNKEDLNNVNIKDTITNLDKAFESPSARIVKETVVYRGYTNTVVNSLEPGDEFEDKGFMSTTSEKYKAESWAHSGGAVMHILLPKGANAISARPYSQIASEHEVLLNRGTKVRIIEKVIDRDNITLYAEYVLAEEPKAKKLSPLERLQKKAAEGKNKD